jgi:hypothetical protein
MQQGLDSGEREVRLVTRWHSSAHEVLFNMDICYTLIRWCFAANRFGFV